MRRASPACARRASRSPLGSAAGYGTPGLPLDRELTRAKLGFDEVHAPVTAVQLARGKAEAQLLFECALLMQDLGRLAADLLLFYTQEFAFVDAARVVHHRLVDHAAEAQSRRVRAGARAQRRGAGVPHRSARHFRQAALRLSARPAAHQAAAVPRHRPRVVDGRHHGRCHRWRAFPSRGRSNSTPPFTPPKKRTRWSRAKAFRSARHIAASARNTASNAPARAGEWGIDGNLVRQSDDRRRSRQPVVGLLASHLGIEFTEWGDDFLRGTMPVEPRTRQPMGYLHGGASLVLAETLGSVAANFVVDHAQVPLPGTGDQRQSSAPGHRRTGDRHRARNSPGFTQPGVGHRNPRSAGTTGVHLASHDGRGGMAPVNESASRNRIHPRDVRAARARGLHRHHLGRDGDRRVRFRPAVDHRGIHELCAARSRPRLVAGVTFPLADSHVLDRGGPRGRAVLHCAGVGRGSDS